MLPPLSLHLKSLEDDDPWIIEQKTFDILNEYLQPNSTTSAVTAAEKLDALIPTKRHVLEGENVESPDSFLLETWGTVIILAKQIPYDHPSQARLIEMIKGLTNLPPTEIKIEGAPSTTRIWIDLPMLSTSIKDFWYESSHRDDTYEQFEQWVNYNSFAARLLESSLQKEFYLGVWTLKTALEQESHKSRDHWYYRIRAAAQWIEQSGNMLFKSLGGSGLSKADLAQMRNGPLYKGESGLSQERWNFWKAKFRALSDDSFPEEVNKSAIHSAEKMEEIQTSGTRNESGAKAGDDAEVDMTS